MMIDSSRFGQVTIEPEDVLLFSRGLFAFENHRHWVLLADGDEGSVAWLQSIQDPEVALALVSPRLFIPDYRVSIGRNQLTPLELAALDQAFVLNVLNRNQGQLTINLKAPVIINLDRRIGRQVVTNDEQPLQMALPTATVRLRKSA
jgi:flagellar assembly factor FliW